MAKYTQDQIDERIQKLPKALQEALFSPAIADKIFDIGNSNDLTIEQAGLLGEEVGNVILGFTKPEDFAKVLQEVLQIPDTDTKKIVGEINQAVLVPLRDLLKSAHDVDVAGTAIGTPVFMQRPSAPPPELKPEWIIKPELRQAPPAPVSGIPPKVVLPEKEIQIPLPTSRPNFAEQNLGGQAQSTPLPDLPAKSTQPVIDLKNTTPPKLPESIPVSKVPPIDLRTQARPVPSPEQSVVSKVELPPTLKAIPDKGVDPYREAIE